MGKGHGIAQVRERYIFIKGRGTSLRIGKFDRCRSNSTWLWVITSISFLYPHSNSIFPGSDDDSVEFEHFPGYPWLVCLIKSISNSNNPLHPNISRHVCYTFLYTIPGSISVSGQLPTYPNINPNLLSIDCCWVRGGVGGQFPRYWYWSQFLRYWKGEISPIVKNFFSC